MAITQVMSESELKLLQRITHLHRALLHHQGLISSTSTIIQLSGGLCSILTPHQAQEADKSHVLQKKKKKKKDTEHQSNDL